MRPSWHYRRPHWRHCGTGMWPDRDIPAGWRAMESPARLWLPSRQASLAHPRGKPGSRRSKVAAGERRTVRWREMDSNHRFRTTTSFVSCPRRTSPVALILCVGNVTRSEISADQGMAKLSLAPHMPNMMANATNAPPIRKRSAGALLHHLLCGRHRGNQEAVCRVYAYINCGSLVAAILSRVFAGVSTPFFSAFRPLFYRL